MNLLLQTGVQEIANFFVFYFFLIQVKSNSEPTPSQNIGGNSITVIISLPGREGK